MKKIYILLLIAISIMFWNCEFPFDTKPTNNNVFELIADYDQNQRVVDTLTVRLSWSDITIEKFKAIKIARFNEHRDTMTYPVGTSVNGWVTFATIANPFKTSRIDTIRDDAIFQYRLRYYNNDNNFYQANASVAIRPTTHVFVPLEFESVQTALASYIVDEGDTIFTCMDEFDTVSDTSYGYKVDFKKDSTIIVVIEVQCD